MRPLTSFDLAFLIVILCLADCLGQVSSVNKEADKAKPSRGKRLFPVFEIVTFPNDPCVGTGNRNGTCLTADECTQRGGANSGTCARSLGICCTFSSTCGQTSNENCTFFTAPTTVSTGTCNLRICPCGDNICQLRLDFNNFVISGPSTLTTTVGEALFDNLVGVNLNGRLVTTDGQCLTDTFQVTNPSGSAPPVICGTNTGEHLYVDANEACNDLTFQFGAGGIGTTLATRNWEIKVTQYSCDFNNLAPDGCTQYFFGNNGVGQVQTFNFQNSEHLANQDQVFCVRREQGFCRICWSATANTDFQVSEGSPGKLNGLNNPSLCCNYGLTTGNVGKDVQGFDCVEIPGAVQAAANTPVPDRICGRSNGLITAAGGAATTVCSTDDPFLIRFVSDTFENALESMSANAGFRLGYFQDATNCV